MTKRDVIKKMMKENRRIDAKMIREALEIVGIVRDIRSRRRRRYDVEPPFTTTRPGGSYSDPRAVYL